MFKLASSVTRSRRRRQIRVKLDEVSRVIGSFSAEGETICALYTEAGDVLAAKGVATRPFVALVPKVTALRENACAVAESLAVPPPPVIHLRGTSWVAAIYALGTHTLVTYTAVPLQTHDTALREIDMALGIGSSATGPLEELGILVREISV